MCEVQLVKIRDIGWNLRKLQKIWGWFIKLLKLKLIELFWANQIGLEQILMIPPYWAMTGRSNIFFTSLIFWRREQCEQSHRSKMGMRKEGSKKMNIAIIHPDLGIGTFFVYPDSPNKRIWEIEFTQLRWLCRWSREIDRRCGGWACLAGS